MKVYTDFAEYLKNQDGIYHSPSRPADEEPLTEEEVLILSGIAMGIERQIK
jgi:hypothetical protein